MTSHSQGKAGGREICFGKYLSVCCPCIPPLPRLLEAAFPNSQQGKFFPQSPLEIPQKSSGVWQALFLVQEDAKAINTIFLLRVITSGQQQLNISWSNFSSSQIHHSECDILFCQTSCLIWFLTTAPLSWIKQIKKNPIPHWWKLFFTNNFVLNWKRSFHKRISWEKYFR